jgi:hypothetical protein
VDIVAFVKAVLDDQLTLVIIGGLILFPILDWITGSARALIDHSFVVDKLDVFVVTQYGGRVVPLLIVLILGRVIAVTIPTALVIPGIDLSIITAGGVAPAIAFLALDLKSIVDNANPKADNPVPTVNS